jgi:hypothetical protein
MAQISLRLEAPNGAWASQVESLIRQVLGTGGSLTLAPLPDALWDMTEASWGFLTGLAECDTSKGQMVTRVTAALRDFEVEARALDAGETQIVVRPSTPSRNGRSVRFIAPTDAG